MASDLPTTLRTLAATPEAVTVEAAQALLVIADRVEAMETELAALREPAGDEIEAAAVRALCDTEHNGPCDWPRCGCGLGRDYRVAARAVLAAVTPKLRAAQWQPIETAPRDRRIIGWTPDGLDLVRWLDPEPDGPQSMGNDGGWHGIATSCFPGRSFGSPDYMREAACQPTLWMDEPANPPWDEESESFVPGVRAGTDDAG